MRIILWLAMALVAVSAFAADAKTKAPLTHTRKGGSAATASDADIEKAIRARFARSKISADHFQVRVQGGVATIEGRTDVIQRKGVATRLARAGGAREVINKIEIGEKAREKASANLAQGRRRVQIKRDEAGRK